MKKKTSIGVVKRINRNMEERCGGAVERKILMRQVARLPNTRAKKKTMMKKTLKSMNKKTPKERNAYVANNLVMTLKNALEILTLKPEKMQIKI
jgi:hypothetical protein